jgi:hypothetical protein
MEYYVSTRIIQSFADRVNSHFEKLPCASKDVISVKHYIDQIIDNDKITVSLSNKDRGMVKSTVAHALFNGYYYFSADPGLYVLDSNYRVRGFQREQTIYVTSFPCGLGRIII